MYEYWIVNILIFLWRNFQLSSLLFITAKITSAAFTLILPVIASEKSSGGVFRFLWSVLKMLLLQDVSWRELSFTFILVAIEHFFLFEIWYRIRSYDYSRILKPKYRKTASYCCLNRILYVKELLVCGLLFTTSQVKDFSFKPMLFLRE